MFKTITVDNGSEFADWEGMQQSAADESEKRVTVFYCHPYCSFERGSNENQNRLVRRKIPKGENFDDRTEDDIQRVENWINDYPREMFGWKTSGELFQEELAKDPAYAFICYIDANYVADSDIQGISENTVLGHHGVGIFWNIQDWEIVQE